MEQRLRGTLAGFMMPSFVVDLPGGGGKRLASTGHYDRRTGRSTFTAPGLTGEKGMKTYEYWDPEIVPVGAMEGEPEHEVEEAPRVQQMAAW